MTHEERLYSVAKAEDTYDLMHHIAWDATVKPALDKQLGSLTKLLVNEALGGKLPEGLTRERVAGMCYGINYISTLLEKILKEGEHALKDLSLAGIHPMEEGRSERG